MSTFTNCVEIIVQGTVPPSSGGTKNVFNVYHYRLSSGPMDTLTQIGGQFITLVQSFITAQLSADFTGNGLRIRLLDDALSQYLTIGYSTVGGIALPRLPNDVAIVLPLQCAQRGKSFRGSKHFGPVPTASVVKDELTATAVTAWNAIQTKLQNTFVSSGTSTYQPFVLSRTLSQLRTNPTTIIGSDVTTVLLNKTIGTMRRRKEKTAR